MRRKNDAELLWGEICKNCKRDSESFGGVSYAVWSDTFKYVDQASRPEDKFSLAILAKDKIAINTLYEKIPLNDYQKRIISQLLEKNEEVLLTLNPFVIDSKFDFLTPILDELVLDQYVQDRLLSLDDYEISILKRIFEYAINYGVVPNKLMSIIINNIGYSSIAARNSVEWLDAITSLFALLKKYEDTFGDIDNKVFESVAVVFRNGGFFPSTLEELKDYNKFMKIQLKETLEQENLECYDLREKIVGRIFSMSLEEAYRLVGAFNLENMPEEYYTEPGIVEIVALKMVLDTTDLDKLKEIAYEIINNPNYEICLFNNILIEENLLLLYAREFNKCKPKFDETNYIGTKDGIEFYDSGYDFYAIVKRLGAFYNDGESKNNYYLEWNDKRYRSHVNALSLIRNDNLAFAEQDGKQCVKVGFFNFDERRFLGGGCSDVNSATESRELNVNIYSSLSFPDRLINCTREWHNELDYERKNGFELQEEFKKNPDFIILDQEVEDILSLDLEAREEYEKLLADTIKAAKDFGNSPVLVINREKIAKNEIKIIREMLDKYIENHDINLLLGIITKFCNNRNGCRGKQHKYIRENYFSNEYFQELLNEIDENILDEHREAYTEHLKSEYKSLRECFYDRTTRDLPKSANGRNTGKGVEDDKKRKR